MSEERLEETTENSAETDRVGDESAAGTSSTTQQQQDLLVALEGAVSAGTHNDQESRQDPSEIDDVLEAADPEYNGEFEMRNPDDTHHDDNQDDDDDGSEANDDEEFTESEVDDDDPEIINSSGMDPHELEEATAAVVNAASRMERSDSILSHDEEEDETESDMADEGFDPTSTERYIQEASVEMPYSLPGHHSRQTTLSRSSFMTSDGEHENDYFRSVSDDIKEALSNVIEISESKEESGDFEVDPDEPDTSNGRDQPERRRSTIQLLESCGALLLPVAKLRTVTERELPFVLRQHRSSESNSPSSSPKNRTSLPLLRRKKSTEPSLTDTREDVLLLHSLFATVSNPPPSLESVARIYDLEKDMLSSQHWMGPRRLEESIPLPTDALISVAGPDKQALVSILCNHDVLVHLSPEFSLSMMRILVRLLTNETDDEYNNECLRTCEWWVTGGIPGETDSTEPKDFQARTHERVRLVRQQQEMIDNARKQRQELSEKSMDGTFTTARQRPDQLYVVVRFLSGSAWSGIRSGPITNLLILWNYLVQESNADHLLAPVARLIGILGGAGMAVQELRTVLAYLSRPLCSAENGVLSPRDCSFAAVDRVLLLRALRAAANGAAPSTHLLKASPRCFFSFGRGKGLRREISPLSAWPFKNDFGMALWFRAETFEFVESSCYPRLLSFRGESGGGIEVSLMPLKGKAKEEEAATVIVVSVYDATGRGSPRVAHRVTVKGCVLVPRVWYHLAIRHTRSRLQGVFSLASRQQISIMLDGKIMLSESLPFPKVSLIENVADAGPSLIDGLVRHADKPGGSHSMTVDFGLNFEGQTGRLLVFNGSLSDASLKALYMATASVDRIARKASLDNAAWDSNRAEKAHKSNALGLAMSRADADDIVLSSNEHHGNTMRGRILNSEIDIADLVREETQDSPNLPPELSGTAFGSKVFMVWDPSRTEAPTVLDLHAGAHVQLNDDIAVSWTVHGARDVIASIGGVQALLSVFRALLQGDIEKLWPASQGTKASHGSGFITGSAVSFSIVPMLLSMLAAFLRGHDRNAREMLRCGGIDVIEHLLLANRGICEDKKNFAGRSSLVGVLPLYPALSKMIVESLLELRAASFHYTGLETTIFSRVMFNVPIWFGNCNECLGVSLYSTLLPVLSSIVKANPGKARDCVGVRRLVDSLHEYANVGDKVLPSDPVTELFDRSYFSGLSAEIPLTLNERRLVMDIFLGMIAQMLLSGTSAQTLGPLLNFASNNLDYEWGQASADINDGRDWSQRKGSRRELYICTTKTATIIYFLLQTRPEIPGLFGSFAACCGGPHGVAAWILCGLVNSFDDTLRSLGVRCLSVYLDIAGPGSDSMLSSESSNASETDLGTKASTVLAQARLLPSNRLTATISNVGKGLAAMGNTAVTSMVHTSRISVKIVYKLLWHLMKAHRSRIGSATHDALIQLLLDNRGLLFSAETVLDALVVKDSVMQSGYRFCNERSSLLLSDLSAIQGKKIRDNGAIISVLRLLRFLSDEMRERWLLDLVGMVSTSHSNLELLLKCPQWQPSLFHLESDVVEEIKVRTLPTLAPSGASQQRDPEETTDVPSSLPEDVRESSAESKSEVLVEANALFAAVPANATPSLPRIHVLFDLSMKFYASLLGDCVRHGGNQALHAVEQAASLQRVCVNGHEVLILLLNHVFANLIEYGTLDVKTMGALPSSKSNEDERNRLLKHSAYVVTQTILSAGSGDIDIASAVDQWRSLRHLTALTAAVVTKSGFGVVQLLDYRDQQASAVDDPSGGLHGIRLPEGNIPGMAGSEYIRILGFISEASPGDQGRIERDMEKRVCVALTAQVLSLLDAFIFPDSLDASQPASQLHGLALVRSNEPRLGQSQGPLLSSLIRLSLVLMCHLEPSSLKFLQCCSRLRCFVYWSIELIREAVALAGYSAAFHELSAPLDRLILSIVLHSHRALSRCSAVLLELEGSTSGKYFADETAQQKNYRRLLRVAFELREIVLAAYRGRNEVLRAALSLRAFESLKLGLEQGNKSESKERLVRTFLQCDWVRGFHDLDLDGDCPMPEMVSNGQELKGPSSTCEGKEAVEALAKETENIISDFNHALDAPFDAYCEDQRQWAETEAVRDLEYDGDVTVKRLVGRLRSDRSESARLVSVRAAAAKSRFEVIERKVCELWNNSPYWKLAKHTDRLNRRILLVRNRQYDDHADASYELMLAQEREKAERDREERAKKKLQEELSEVMRRNTSAFSGQGALSRDDDEDDALDAADDEYAALDSAAKENDEASADSSNTAAETDNDLAAEFEQIDIEEVIGDEELANDDSWARKFIWADTESVVARFDKVAMVSLQTITEGKLLLTTHGLYFRQTGDAISVMTKDPVQKDHDDEENSLRWRLSRLLEVHGRRFMLRAQALELFFSDTHELFLNFSGGTRDRDRFYAKLRNSCKVPLLCSPKSLNPRVVFKRSQLTSLWRKRQISNFEYLMQLNKLAGRTFNDITQYPVFPWVLADYTSETIDLGDSRVYRDLTKPMGAQNPDRLAQLLERYKDLESFGFAENERFLYGSHYSSPGMVLHFMLRQEPFTSMAVELQSGRFDCPDRLFFDLAGCWKSCLTSTSDVKELIPEFYTLPEMFLNTNKFPLGKTQSNHVIDDVALPPWANGCAYEFVRIHRLALESEYVSRHLNQWVDLIFGFKQRGPEAEKAYNVFHYLSYEGAVDLDKITDEVDRKATESHIQNFGQTPSQLLTKDPHPGRNSAEDSWKPLIYDATMAKHLRCHTPGKQFGGRGLARGAVCCIHVMTESLLVVYADLSIGSYRWNPQRPRATEGNHPFAIRMDKHKQIVRRELSTSRAAIKRGSATPLSLKDSKSCHSVGSWSFAFTLGGSVRENLRRKAAMPPNRLAPTSVKDMLASAEASSIMVSCGYWDDSVKVHSMDGSKLLGSANGGHQGAIRCLALGDDGGLMVTGGEDATCRVWLVDHPDMAVALSDGYVQTALGGSHDRDQLLSCCHVLWGHDTPVSCVALSSDLDVTVSGSLGGRVCVHTIRRGKFVRSFLPCSDSTGIRKIALETHGSMAIHTEDGGLHAYTVNGVHLASTEIGELLHDMRVCGENMIVTGGESGQVVMRTLSDLQICSKLDLHRHGPIRCLSMTPSMLNPIPQYLFIGSDDGMITIVDHDALSSGKHDGDAPAETVTFEAIQEHSVS